MSFKEVLDYERALTQPIRDEVARIESQVKVALNELVVPWEGDLGEEEEDEEED